MKLDAHTLVPIWVNLLDVTPTTGTPAYNQAFLGLGVDTLGNIYVAGRVANRE